MSFSRRHFLQTTGYSGAFLLAHFHGASAWAGSSHLDPCLLRTTPEYPSSIEKYMKYLAPGHDEFVTEYYASELEAIFTQWINALRAGHATPDELQAVLPATLEATPFSTSTAQPLRNETPLQTEIRSFSPPTRMSRDEFIRGLNKYLDGLLPLQNAETFLSGINVISESPLRLTTSIRYVLLGHLDGQHQERTGAWTLNWEKAHDHLWVVRKWVIEHEQRVSLGSSGFIDITTSCMPDVTSLTKQLQRGAYYWMTVLDGACGVDIYGNNGIAAGDSNGNGYDDIYVCQPAGLPNRLYLNRGDGTFQDVTEQAGVGIIDGTASALFLDLNNSGHQDLIVVRSDGPLLFQNQGDGTFQLKPDVFRFKKEPQGTFTAVAATDYDRDGMLDLYFCLYNYYEGLNEYQFPQPYYDAQNGPPNFLLKNHGGYIFEDVTAKSGLNANNNRYSFSVGWDDYDNNGWQDLYVVNDFGRNNLYRNNGNGTFTDCSEAAGLEDAGAGMSLCWLDYDNNGLDDLYVANMWSAAGKRISTQPEFLPHAGQTVRSAYKQFANGNCLFRSNGEGKAFDNVTPASGTALGRWSWSSDAWDIDHDGFPDIYIANGCISGPIKDDLSSFFWRQVVTRSMEPRGNSKDYADAWSAINQLIRSDHSWSGYQRNDLYLNNRDGTFTNAAGVLGLDFLGDSRSYSLADIDGDGRLEVILKSRTAPQLRILHNDISPLGNSINISLTGTRSNRDAIGARVELNTPQGKRRATVRAGSGFLSQHSKTLTIGLGTTSGPLDATVRWPNGTTEHFYNLLPQHHVYIIEGSTDIKQRPFRPTAPSDRKPAQNLTDSLPTSFATWLVEPLAPPNFSLRDQNGKVVSLSNYKGSFQLIVFWRNHCTDSDQLLESIQTHSSLWAKHDLHTIAILAETPRTPKIYSFPTIKADKTTLGAYDICYRYLFARHHDMPLPTAFLLDRNGGVIRIYSGPFNSADILADLNSAPKDQSSRMQLALPFRGRYLGSGMHRNYFTLGVAYLQFGYTENAIEAFDQSIQRGSYLGPSYYNLGLIYLGRDDIDKAHEYLQRAVTADPNNADAWNNLGVALGYKHKLHQARIAFEHALQISPAYWLALQNLAKLDNYEGDKSRAAAVLQKAVQMSPSNPDLHVDLALIFSEKNELDRAGKEFRQAIRLQPTNAKALNGLGEILIKEKNFREAAAQFRKCISVDPNSEQAHLSLALIYLKEGKPEKARTLLENYLQMHPTNNYVRSVLSRLR